MLREGMIFTIPLEPSGEAVGVLARANGKGKAFGYFFRPASTASQLNRDDSVFVARFGDHALHTGRWRVVGDIEGWSRENWPLPTFIREHDDPKLAYLTQYNDVLEVISETIVQAEPSDWTSRPRDVQYGSGVVEKVLSRSING